jgi:copper homeostasis protein
LRRRVDSGTLRASNYRRDSTVMPQEFVLEICAESLDCAVSAQRAKAGRIELCSDLASDGITPSAGTLQMARELLHLPIYVLIRPRPGDFLYAAREFEIMRRDIQIAKELSMDGIVAGVLDTKSRVDIKRTGELVRLANPLPVTFHRAFDQTPNLEDALEAVVETGAKRILTSGCKRSAIDGISRLARLVDLARDRIIIMPGGGIRASNVVRLVRATSVREAHTSLGAAARPNGRRTGDRSSVCGHSYERKVREIAELLGNRAARPKA